MLQSVNMAIDKAVTLCQWKKTALNPHLSAKLLLPSIPLRLSWLPCCPNHHIGREGRREEGGRETGQEGRREGGGRSGQDTQKDSILAPHV